MKETEPRNDTASICCMACIDQKTDSKSIPSKGIQEEGHTCRNEMERFKGNERSRIVEPIEGAGMTSGKKSVSYA